jgi:hypothetical protein
MGPRRNQCVDRYFRQTKIQKSIEFPHGQCGLVGTSPSAKSLVANPKYQYYQTIVVSQQCQTEIWMVIKSGTIQQQQQQQQHADSTGTRKRNNAQFHLSRTQEPKNPSSPALTTTMTIITTIRVHVPPNNHQFATIMTSQQQQQQNRNKEKGILGTFSLVKSPKCPALTNEDNTQIASFRIHHGKRKIYMVKVTTASSS